MLELALGLPAVGAVAVTVLQRKRGFAVLAGLVFGGAALAAVVAGSGRMEALFGIELRLPPPLVVIVVATFAAGALAVLLVPPGAARLPMLWSVLAGLTAVNAIAVLADPLLMVLVVLLVACGQAALPALRPFVERIRAPAFGALALALGLVFAGGVDSPQLEKVAGLALVLGFTAMVGLAPYLRALDPGEPAPASSIVWLAFLGPGIAVAMAVRVAPQLSTNAGAAYTEVLLALGLFNIAMGVAGSFFSRQPSDGWRYSLLGDWGLALVGFGLLTPAGSGAAYLLLISILLVRLPLYLVARPALVRRQEAPLSPWTLVVAAALAGAAPFIGFPARLLLLRSATVVAWPLAFFLVLAMLAWLPQSLRLARTIVRPGPLATAVLAALGVVSAAIGIYPAPLLRFLGMG